MQNFTELYEVERRYEELAHRMSTPDAAANADEYARMMRDYKELTPLIEEYRRYTDLQQQEADAKEMLAAESDPAFAAMRRCRRRGGRAVCPQPVAQVHNVRRQARMAVRNDQRKPDGARRREGDRLFRRGAGRLQPPEIRKRRPPRPARARDRNAGPHPHLHRHRGRHARGRGGRAGDRPKRPAH